MTVRCVEGFEDSTIVSGRGIYNASAHSLSTVKAHQTISGYGGIQSLKFTASDEYRLTVAAGAAGDIIHVAFYADSAAAAGVFYLQFYDSGNTLQAAIDFGTDGLVRLRRGASGSGTLLATSAVAFTRDAWHTLKIVFTLREAASSGRIQVYIDGSASTLVDTGAGVDCRNSSVDDAVQIRFGSNNSVTSYWDDFYWVSSAETVPDEPLYIVALRPTSDDTIQSTSSGGGTGTYANVDENPIVTTDYNEIGTAAQEDYLGMGDLSQTPTAIYCVAPHVWATGEGTITNGRTLVKSNGTLTRGTNQTLATGGTYGLIWDSFTTDPSGGGAWTAARVNAMLNGYQANT